MNKQLKKILNSEKEDLHTLKKVFNGEVVKPRFSFKNINILKLLADNWLMTIILIAFFLGGFFLGAVNFENVCSDALLECQDDCNSFYGVSNSAFYNFTPEVPVLPSESYECEQYS